MDYSERLINSTVRIEATFPNGAVGTGTGFFFDFKFDTTVAVTIPVIVTNKHVVTDKDETTGIVTAAESLKLFLKEKTGHGEPDYSKVFELKLDNPTSLIVDHPNNDIDLCVIPLAFLDEKLNKIGKTFYFDIFSEAAIPSKEVNEKMLAIEEVYMIGYPNGLWDKVHNLPLARRGITATHPNIDYNSKKEFVVDIAAFPGSSGSPVFLYNPNFYSTKENIEMGGRIYLLGILYAGPLITMEGEVLLHPTNTTSQINIPMNLG